MRYEFEITTSTEVDRLQIRFTDSEFATFAGLYLVNWVGNRRAPDRTPTHWVFPPEVEDQVRAHVARREDAAINGPARLAAAQAARAEQMAKLDAASKKKRASKRQAALATGEIPVGETSLGMPYAAGAPALLRAAGAVWYVVPKVWGFPRSQHAEIVKLVPKLKSKVLRQQKKDAERGRADYVSDEDLQDMNDDGLLGNMGWSLADLRREYYKGGRR